MMAIANPMNPGLVLALLNLVLQEAIVNLPKLQVIKSTCCHSGLSGYDRTRTNSGEESVREREIDNGPKSVQRSI